MSDERRTSPTGGTGNSDECAFVQENAAAFALQALEPDEIDRILRHAASHPVCQHYLDRECAIVDLLPFSMPLLDPPDLAVRLNLFDRVDAERRTPVQATVSTEPVRFFAPQMHQLPASTRTIPPAPSPSALRWVQNLGSVLLAPLCIALLVVSVWAYNLNDEVESLRNSNPPIDAQTLMTSMDVYAMTSSCTNCTTHGQIGSLPDQSSAILLAWDLDPAEDHEVWCEERDGNKWMVSSLDVNANGAAMQAIKFPKPIEGYRRIYVAGSDNKEGEAPELLVAMPEQHDDNPPTESTPSA